MMIYLQNIPIILLFLTILFCDFGFCKIFHGAGIQLTNQGTGIYYKPGVSINVASQAMGEIGFHFDNITENTNYYHFYDQNQAVFFEIATLYRRELFKDAIAGIFRPVIIMQGGGSVEMDTISLINIPGKWIFKYASGMGFQFYNGRLLNEIMLKLNQYFLIDISMAFQLSIYWR